MTKLQRLFVQLPPIRAKRILGNSSFVIRLSLVIRHSTFVIAILIDVAVPASARSVIEEALKRGSLAINPSSPLWHGVQIVPQRGLIWLPTRDAARRVGRLLVRANQRVLPGQESQALAQDGQHQVRRHVRSGFLAECLHCFLHLEVLRRRRDLDGERMAKGAVLVVANGCHAASIGVGLVAKAALLLFQLAQRPVYAAQHFSVETEVSLVVESKRTGVLQSARPPPAKRRVVRVKRVDTWVERVPPIHRPQVAVAAPALVFRDTQQSLLSLVILVTVRAIPHVGG